MNIYIFLDALLYKLFTDIFCLMMLFMKPLPIFMPGIKGFRYVVESILSMTESHVNCLTPMFPGGD